MFNFPKIVVVFSLISGNLIFAFLDEPNQKNNCQNYQNSPTNRIIHHLQLPLSFSIYIILRILGNFKPQLTTSQLAAANSGKIRSGHHVTGLGAVPLAQNRDCGFPSPTDEDIIPRISEKYKISI
jgi:hypothetical protein